jgi:long-chain acyl-CoA synthetase
LRNVYWAGWVGVMHTTPLRRFLSRAAQVFPVDPDRGFAAALDTAQALLRSGRSIVWFPEGRRSPTGELQPFLPGIGRLLCATHTAAVPAAIDGAFAAWPKHRRRPKLRVRLAVVFGAQLTPSEPEQAAADLESAVRRLAAAGNTCVR